MWLPGNGLKDKFFLMLVVMTICSPVRAQIYINELLASNSASMSDPDFGEFADWVELYNPSPFTFSLEGYTLTDNPDIPDKWKLPDLNLLPQQYLLIWTDDRDKYPGDTAYSVFQQSVITVSGLHTNFKLSVDGEYVGLYNPQQQLADEITFCVQTHDISYGRNPQDLSDWLYYNETTPGAANHAYGSSLMEISGVPDFSIPEGFYTEVQNLNISSAVTGAGIRFSFDGSTPDLSAPLFTGSFEIDRNYVIKARLYEPGKMPGPVITKTYFINEVSDIPVISISSDQANLYDFDFGIIQNAIKEREVPAHIEYFEPDGNRAFSSGVGIRLFGSTIYNLPQRPLSIRFKADYGDEVLNYPLFEDKNISQFTSFLLRNGGNDYNMAFFRDGLAVKMLAGKMDIDYQAYKPCLVFINGEFEGIYEIRERLDENYIGQNQGINPANIDYLEDSLVITAGNAYDFVDLQQFISSHNLQDSAHYAYVTTRINIHEYINYMIHRVFIGYRIAEFNNRYWCDRDTKSPWRWIIADMEHAFGQLSGDTFAENTLDKLAGYTGDLPEWATFLFKNLLQNTGFRDEFIQRMALYTQTIYHPEVTTALTNGLQEQLSPYMPRHIARWESPASMAAWGANVQFINTFLTERPAYIRQHIAASFEKSDSALVTCQVTGSGHLQVCGVPVESPAFEAYFFKETGIRLTAIPNPGYRFVGWQGINGTETEVILSPVGDTSITAIFEPWDIHLIPPVIETDTVLSAAMSPWYGVENIIVKPGARLIVEGGTEIRMSDQVSLRIEGGLAFLGTPDQPVRMISNPEPWARLPEIQPTGRWGVIAIENATDSILLEYSEISGGSFGEDRSRFFATLSAYDSDIRLQYCTIQDGMMPLYANGGSMFIGHSYFHTYNSCNGFISLYNMEAPVVEYSTFPGNRAADTDGIDLKGVNNAIIRHNEVYGFLGSNCDGIDLGIYSQNNLLTYNIIHDCTDKGISIGSQSNAQVFRNVIYDCQLGVAVKDSLAIAYIDQNTFFGNNIAVSCYEKSTLRGGGQAYISNTILAGSLEASVQSDQKSVIEVRYSLSDREHISGTGNLNIDPGMVHPSTGNFALQEESPAVDAGDPASPVDPDGSITDMGAYYIHTGEFGLRVYINEYNYLSPDNYPAGDWVELYNQTATAVDLEGWRLTHGSQEYIFPAGAVIAVQDYTVVCSDTLLFKAIFGDESYILGNTHLDFDNTGGKIALYDADGNLMHSVHYSKERPWPPLAAGLGATVELEPGREGNSPVDWRESYVLNGSPGTVNSQPPDLSGLFINEILASNSSVITDEYGDYDDWFEIYNGTDDTINTGGIYLTDDSEIPYLWQLPLHVPEQTNIAPHDFLLIWADEEPGEGFLHVDFKLSASGESVFLFQRQAENYVLLESMDYNQQYEDISWGRYPDGSTFTALLSPTPGASNLILSLSLPEKQVLKLYPNPANGFFMVQADEINTPYQVQVINSTGQIIWSSIENYNNHLLITTSKCLAGLVNVVVTDAHGKLFTGKIIVAYNN